MELVVITPESILPLEGEALNLLFENGLERLHIRKPGAAKEDLCGLIEGIDPRYRIRAVLHDHFGLVREFGLGGVHLNRRNQEPPGFRVGSVSRSCHSVGEVAASVGECDYVFLSPVFDSISKTGYGRAFSESELVEAGKKGVINENVYALGGIDENNIPDVARFGFGGVAILGALWQDYLKDPDPISLAIRFRRLAMAAGQI